MTPQIHVHVFFNIYLKQPFFLFLKGTLKHTCAFMQFTDSNQSCLLRCVC